MNMKCTGGVIDGSNENLFADEKWKCRNFYPSRNFMVNVLFNFKTTTIGFISNPIFWL